MKKKRDVSYHKYFTKVQLAKKFGYASANSFMSSKSRGVMWEGIKFVINSVEKHYETKLEELKKEINRLIDNQL